MNRWILASVVAWSITGITGIFIGIQLIEYSSVATKIILYGGLGSSCFCFWKGLGIDMHRNAQG